MAHDLVSTDKTAAFTASVLMALINELAAKREVRPEFVDHVEGLIEHYFHQVWGGSTESHTRGKELRTMLRHPDFPLVPKPELPGGPAARMAAFEAGESAQE